MSDLLDMAAAAYRKGDYQQAITLLAMIDNGTYEENWFASLYLGMSYVKTANPEKAEPILRGISAKCSNEDLRKTASAMLSWRRSTEEPPAVFVVSDLLAMAARAYRKRDYQQAITLLAMIDNGTYEENWFASLYLGMSYTKTDCPEKAEPILRNMSTKCSNEDLRKTASAMLSWHRSSQEQSGVDDEEPDHQQRRAAV